MSGDRDIERDLERAWARLDDGDLDGAAAALESARAAAPDDPEVLELQAELAVELDDFKGALRAYERWSEVEPEEPLPHIRAAEARLDLLGDAPGAVASLRGLLEGSALDPEDEADARHLLGLALEEEGDRRGMIREWLQVLRLDTAHASGRPLLPTDEFAEVASDALLELPDEIQAWLANVPVLVDDRPSEDMVSDGVDPRLLGLFSGYAMPDQSSMYGALQPTVIHLFQRNLESEVDSADDLAEQIRITVLHETAHYFGYEDDELDRLGLG